MVEIGGQVLVVNCGKGAVVESLSYQHPSSYILGVDDVFNDVAMALDQANHTNNLQVGAKTTRAGLHMVTSATYEATGDMCCKVF